MTTMNQKWFYVTGCDSGFGAMVVKLLSAEGHGVFAGCYSKESVEKLEKENENIVPVHLDVCNVDSVTAAADEIKKRLGDRGLDGVVNNAGILVTPGPVEWTPLNAFRKMYEVNVIGTVAVTQSVLPLIRRARGRIVNVASIAGRVGLPGQPAYCASKYAVEAVSDVLRREMLDWGVTVHIIEPGIFPNTGLYDTFKADSQKMWNGLPEDLREDYGEKFHNNYIHTLEGALSALGTKDSSYVPKAMVKALTSTCPKYRYRVGYDSKTLYTLLSNVHERIQDFIMTSPFPGLPRPVAPAKAPADGKATALRRYTRGNDLFWILIAVFFSFLWMRGNIVGVQQH